MRNLIVFASNFVFTFPTQVYDHLTKLLVPGQRIARAALHVSNENAKSIEGRNFNQMVAQIPGPHGCVGIAVHPEEECVASYLRQGIPIVLIDEEMDGVSTVCTDNYHGGALAGEYLVKAGRKRLAIICGDTKRKGAFNAVRRLQGFQDAARHAGLEVKAIAQVVDYSYNDGVATMEDWVSKHLDIDAIFCAAGDDCALGVLRTLHKYKRSVPDDIALIGYDDNAASATATPPLTTIRQPIQTMVDTAYQWASNSSSQLLAHPLKKVFHPTLVKRKTA